MMKNDYSITNKKEIQRELILNKNTVIENDEKILLDFVNRQNIKKFEKDKNVKTTMIRINTLRIIVEYDIIRQRKKLSKTVKYIMIFLNMNEK